MLKLSIITINYNNLEGLKRTVESVINQTWKEFEYIIIDGGSTDGGFEYLKENSKSFSYWISEPDQGIYNAMNKGIIKATGEYLLFLNSGDHLNSNDVLDKNFMYLINYDLIYFNMFFISDGVKKISFLPEKLMFSYFFDGGTLFHPSTFIKKELFNIIGLYDENLKIVSDWKFFLFALIKFNATYFYVNSSFSTFYEGGISTLKENQQLMKLERDSVLQMDFSFLLNDTKEIFRLKRIIRNLSKSRKINWLIKLGLLEKF